MTNLSPTPNVNEVIPAWDTSTPLLGGNPTSPLNMQAQGLLNLLMGYVAKYATADGANMQGFKHSAIGSLLRTLGAHADDAMYTTDFDGMDITGAVDSTAAVQAAFTAGRLQGGKSRTLIVRAGTYTGSGRIDTGSNIHVVFEPGVFFNWSGLPNETTSLFNVSGQTNCIFEGNGATLKGSRATANSAIEGNQAAFFVYGSKNVLIRDFNIQDFATDGITLSGEAATLSPCVNVRVEGCNVTNCRRNAMSIIYAEGVVVDGGIYEKSNGAPHGPWAGIDVEPNENQHCTGIFLLNVHTNNNAGGGLLLVPSAQSLHAGSDFSVTIRGGQSYRDGSYISSNYGRGGLQIASGSTWANKVYGQITVESYVVKQPYAAGVWWENWDADMAPRVSLRDVLVLDPDYSLSAPGNLNRVGFVMYASTANTATTTVGNAILEDCRAEDTRTTARMVNGFWLEADTGKQIKKVRIRNPRSVNYTDTNKFDVKVGAALSTSGGCVDVDVVYEAPRLTTAIPSGSIGSWMGQRVSASANAQTYTLPPLANSIGGHYEVYVPYNLTAGTVAAAGSENIKFYGVAVANTISVAPGDCVMLRNTDGTQWKATALA